MYKLAILVVVYCIITVKADNTHQKNEVDNNSDSNNLHKIKIEPSDVGWGEAIMLAVLKKLKESLATGYEPWGIPILEPWKISFLEFDLSHEIGKLQGSLSNVTIIGLSTFEVDYLKYPLEEGYLNLNLNVSHLSATGNYDVQGMVADLFDIYGNGAFEINMTDFHLESYIEIITIGSLMKVTYLDANISISALPGYFHNFMNGDEDLEPLFNKLIPEFAPEAMLILWPEIAPSVNPLIMDILNQLFLNMLGRKKSEISNT